MSAPPLLPPGSTIGIIGGGQLGRMTALAAARLGYRSHIYCPEEDSPAAQVAAAATVGAAAATAAAVEHTLVLTHEACRAHYTCDDPITRRTGGVPPENTARLDTLLAPRAGTLRAAEFDGRTRVCDGAPPATVRTPDAT